VRRARTLAARRPAAIAHAIREGKRHATSRGELAQGDKLLMDRWFAPRVSVAADARAMDTR
jgi:hypothetical protein